MTTQTPARLVYDRSRYAAVADGYRCGLSPDEIAVRLGITTRQVWSIATKARAAGLNVPHYIDPSLTAPRLKGPEIKMSVARGNLNGLPTRVYSADMADAVVELRRLGATGIVKQEIHHENQGI